MAFGVFNFTARSFINTGNNLMNKVSYCRISNCIETSLYTCHCAEHMSNSLSTVLKAFCKPMNVTKVE